VQLFHLVTNPTESSYGRQFSWSPGWNYYAYENSLGLDIWPLVATQEPVWSPDTCIAWVNWTLTVPAYSTLEYYRTWDLRDYDGFLVQPGVYEIFEDFTDTSLRFTVIPEPGALLLLVAAAVPLLIKHKR